MIEVQGLSKICSDLKSDKAVRTVDAGEIVSVLAILSVLFLVLGAWAFSKIQV
jgi:hypothetical protein